ncbi:MAG: CheR family methyltransferase, partial [Pseudomonadota bacterium]
MQPSHHATSQKSAPATGGVDMTADEFERVAARVLQMAGIVLEPHKRQMIISRLSRRLRAREFATVTEYLDHLDRGRDATELQEFVNTLTTNLTSFFRENHHFKHFEQTVLPQFKNETQKKLRIWSAGCSSGEEPYSIVLSTLETLGRVPKDMRILATDLDTKMLDRGRAQKYPTDRVKDVEHRYRRHMRDLTGEDMVAMPKASET